MDQTQFLVPLDLYTLWNVTDMKINQKYSHFGWKLALKDLGSTAGVLSAA